MSKEEMYLLNILLEKKAELRMLEQVFHQVSDLISPQKIDTLLDRKNMVSKEIELIELALAELKRTK
jgi:transcriptional regulator CtsR